MNMYLENGLKHKIMAFLSKLLKARIKPLMALLLVATLFSCKKDITDPEGLIEANLRVTSSGSNWDSFISKRSILNIKTIIGGQVVSNVDKTIST